MEIARVRLVRRSEWGSAGCFPTMEILIRLLLAFDIIQSSAARGRTANGGRGD